MCTERLTDDVVAVTSSLLALQLPVIRSQVKPTKLLTSSAHQIGFSHSQSQPVEGCVVKGATLSTRSTSFVEKNTG